MPRISQYWQSMLKRHPAHTVAVSITLTIGLFLPQVAMNWRIYQDSNHIRRQELRLQHLSDRATYLDEVLTMSALMNASTGDRIWEERYQEFVPELDAVIEESMHLVPNLYASDDTQQIDLANRALIALESRSFLLVQQKKQPVALRLLLSQDYKTQKRIYAAGVAQRNVRIQQQLQAQSDSYERSLQWSWGIMAASLGLLIPVWLIVLHILRLYLKDRAVAESALYQKNQDLIEAIDKLQQAQRLIQAEKIAGLGQLVAGIAHELNNPINFIAGNLPHVEHYASDLVDLLQLYQQHSSYSSCLIQEKIDDIDLEFLTQDLKKLLRSMEQGTDRVKEIVIALRTFSRLDESERKTVDIHPGLESAILLVQHRLSTTPNRPAIQLVREYNNLPKIDCCPGQLNQVVHSILSNAIDAIEEANCSMPIIRIQTNIIDGKWVRISIADNGIGIPPIVQAKMFDPFFTTKAVGKGNGLGLSISYQIVTEYHQGKLYCSSELNQGSEFFIEIPYLLS